MERHNCLGFSAGSTGAKRSGFRRPFSPATRTPGKNSSGRSGRRLTRRSLKRCVAPLLSPSSPAPIDGLQWRWLTFGGMKW